MEKAAYSLGIPLKISAGGCNPLSMVLIRALSRCLVLATACCLAAGSLLAETWHLDDNTSFEAKLIRASGNTVIFETADGRQLVSFSRLKAESREKVQAEFPEAGKVERPANPVQRPAPPKVSASPKAPNPPQADQVAPGKVAVHPGLKYLDVGDLPPRFWGRTQDDRENVLLNDLRGKKVVVLFWATWDERAREEALKFNQLHQAGKQIGFEVISVSLDRSAKVFYDFEKRANMQWLHRYDPKMQIAGEWGVIALPTAVYINENGVIAKEHIPAEEMLAILQESVRR